MATDARRLLVLDALPGPERLATLRDQGLRRLVNLCGVDLTDIYGTEFFASFHMSHYIFPDVFSPGLPATGEENWAAINVNL